MVDRSDNHREGASLRAAGAEMTASEVDLWFAREVLPLESVLMQFLQHNWRNASDISDLRQEVYVRVYEAALARIPDRPKQFVFATARNLLIDRAELFSSKNENEKALPLLDAAVDLAPDYAEAWSHRAYIEYRLNNYPAALGDLRRALALDPNHFRALDGMAKILTQIGEKKAALEAYDQLLKIHPNIEGGETARDELKKEVEGQGI